MKIITKRDAILKVADRWYEQYQPLPRADNNGPMATRVWESLKALDRTTATATDVAAIIGNDSWTNLKCDECGIDVEAIIVVGQEPDYESRTASLCLECLTKAALLMRQS